MKIIQGILFSLLSISLCHAEYYLEYPEPELNNVVYIKSYKHKKIKHIVHHKKKIHKKIVRYTKPKSSCHISVYYVYPKEFYACPEGWDSEYCYQKMKSYTKRKFTKGFITFNNNPTSYKNTYIPKGQSETYDQRTIDDDVMRDPNMNNQY